jgi:hypothetical protein
MVTRAPSSLKRLLNKLRTFKTLSQVFPCRHVAIFLMSRSVLNLTISIAPLLLKTGTDYPEWVYDLVPTPQQAQAALYPALGVALFVMITIFLIYIPR